MFLHPRRLQNQNILYSSIFSPCLTVSFTTRRDLSAYAFQTLNFIVSVFVIGDRSKQRISNVAVSWLQRWLQRWVNSSWLLSAELARAGPQSCSRSPEAARHLFEPRNLISAFRSAQRWLSGPTRSPPPPTLPLGKAFELIYRAQYAYSNCENTFVHMFEPARLSFYYKTQRRILPDYLLQIMKNDSI